MKHIPLIVACIVIIVLAITTFLSMALEVKDIYSGNVVFDTETDYLAFKEEVINSGATWGRMSGKMEMLASTPPIIVEFNVSVPREYAFPYGEKDEQCKTWVFLVFFFMAIGLTFAASFHFLIGAGRIQ